MKLVTLFILALVSAQVFAQTTTDTRSLSPNLDVTLLANDVWMHTSWQSPAGFGRVQSNGLVVLSGKEALLIDTAWGDSLTAVLLDWLENDLKVQVRRAVVTHWHEDKMGGIKTLQKNGTVVYALPQTAEIALDHGLPQPDSLLSPIHELTVGDRTIQTFFAGPGHTPDNLTVWLDDESTLFGGCLIRPQGTNSMGYIGDAVMEEWPKSIEKLASQFPDASIVIPSHGPPAGHDLLQENLDLLKTWWLDAAEVSTKNCLERDQHVASTVAENNPQTPNHPAEVCAEARTQVLAANDLYPQESGLAIARLALNHGGYLEIPTEQLAETCDAARSRVHGKYAHTGRKNAMYASMCPIHAATIYNEN